MSEEVIIWRVTWGLEVFSHPRGSIPILDNSPDVNCFRLTFATKEDATQFKVEMQRYLGDLLQRLAENVPAKIERLSL